MKKLLAAVVSVITVFSLAACEKNGAYSAGYTDGYIQGLQAAATETETSAPLPVQIEPQNGWVFEEIVGRESLATLSIRTFGSGGFYFVIDPVEFPVTEEGEFHKLRAQLQANNFYIRLYVRGGSTAEINLPLGEYAICYAQGSDWYGEEALFGPETVYYRFDDTFLFRKNAKGYTKWSVSSADAEPISESEFPKK